MNHDEQDGACPRRGGKGCKVCDADRATLLHAAELLEAEARVIRGCETYATSGKWPDDAANKDDHDNVLATARALREMASE